MFKKILALAAVVLATQDIFAQNLRIIGTELKGTGCGPATAQTLITSDGLTLSVLFDKYIAEIGVGSENPNLNLVKKDCHVLITVEVPFGMQYAISQTDYNGFAALPASAAGFHRFTQIIPGAPIVSAREAQLRGPTIGNFNVSVVQKPGRMTYSTCNARTQVIDLFSELQVSYLLNTSDRSKAQINLDSTDTGVDPKFKLSWRPCR